MAAAFVQRRSTAAGNEEGSAVNINKVTAAYNKQIMHQIVKKILHIILCWEKGFLKMHSRCLNTFERKGRFE
jgi:hypothetical protein